MRFLQSETPNDRPTPEELEKYQDELTPEEWDRVFSGQYDHLYLRLAVKKEPGRS